MSVFALALALGAATPAVQEFTETQKDARCVVALQKMTDGIEDKAGQTAVTGIMLFYLGRLSVRIAPTQMEGVINAADETLDASEHKSHALVCIEGMRTLSGADKLAG